MQRFFSAADRAAGYILDRAEDHFDLLLIIFGLLMFGGIIVELAR